MALIILKFKDLELFTLLSLAPVVNFKIKTSLSTSPCRHFEMKILRGLTGSVSVLTLIFYFKMFI